jgi:Cd2+-exporting ATPase
VALSYDGPIPSQKELPDPLPFIRARRGPDVERGTGEHHTLIISIQGMDCSGCFARVDRALHPIPSVKLEGTDLLASRATVTYDTAYTDANHILATVTTQSGFTCHVIFDGKAGERQLKVRCSSSLYEEDVLKIEGVTRMRDEGKGIYDIGFDPAHVHARDVLRSLQDWGATLVPESEDADTAAAKDLRVLLIRTIVSAVLTVPVLIFAWAPLPPNPGLYGAFSLALTTPIQWGCALYIHLGALRVLVKQRTLDMDLLVTISTTTAYFYSVVSYALSRSGSHISDAFFETSALLVTLILLGRLVSAWSRGQATSALRALQQLVPDTALLVGPHDSVVSIQAPLVERGDIIRVPPHTRVPVDGTVTHGTSELDEASLTGESGPMAKQIGDAVFAGTLNLNGQLDLRVTSIVGENTVSNISTLMREAQASRVPLQDMADRVASWITPVAVTSAILAFIAWALVGVVTNHRSGKAFATAITYTIAVLVVSCPCALGLAVPLVFVIATTLAGKSGVLIKDAAVLQRARLIDTIIFDKTGTLTIGELRVVDAWADANIRDAEAMVLALAKGDRHPIAIAIAQYLSKSTSSNEKHHELPLLTSLKSVPGSGLEAILPDGTVLRGGSPVWLNVANHRRLTELSRAARSIFGVTHGSQLIAVYGLADELRPGIREGVQTLLRQGLDVQIVSGDNTAVVGVAAHRLGLPPTSTILGNRTVADKAAHVSSLQRIGRKVLFVGDGTNDGPALAQADIGVSLSTGTDLATSAAHIVLMAAQPDIPKSILALVRLSIASIARVRLNFAWCVIYNVLAITLAAGATVKFRIPPAYAGLGELVSVLPVVIIAFTMYFHQFG